MIPLQFEVPTLDIVYTFLFLLPGFLTFKIIAFFKAHPRSYDTFEKTAWSLLMSGISLSISYILVFGTDIPTTTVNPLQLIDLFGWSLTAAFLLGISGTVLYKKWIEPDPHTPRSNAWESLDVNAEPPIRISVLTNEGTEIGGKAMYIGSVTNNDLLLYKPRIIRRGDKRVVESDENDGTTTVKEVDRIIRTERRGEAVYIPESNIARAFVHTDIRRAGTRHTLIGVLKGKSSLLSYLKQIGNK